MYGGVINSPRSNFSGFFFGVESWRLIGYAAGTSCVSRSIVNRVDGMNIHSVDGENH